MNFNACVRPETISSPTSLAHPFGRAKLVIPNQKNDYGKNESATLEDLYGMEFVAAYVLCNAYANGEAKPQAVLFRFENCDVLLKVNRCSGCLEMQLEALDLRAIRYSVPLNQDCYYWQLDYSSLHLTGNTLISFKLKLDSSSNDAQRAEFNLGNGRIISEANRLYIIDT